MGEDYRGRGGGLAEEGRGEPPVWASEEDENKMKTDFLFSFILMEQTA